MNNILSNLETSEIRKITDKASKLKDCINLSIGDPFFNTPLSIKRSTISAIKKNKTKYSNGHGENETLSTISKYVEDNLGINYDTNEIVITSGATSALNIVLKSILNTNDEVIIISPSYPLYKPLIQINSGVPVEVNVDNNFNIDISNIAKAINNKTKAILINYPNNPLGTLIDTKEQNDLIKLAKKYNLFLICDEVYSAITFNEFTSMGKYKCDYQKLILVNSFSKSHNLTGHRLGYILSNSSYTKVFSKANYLMNVGVATFIQHGLTKINKYTYTRNKKYYSKSISKICQRLESSKIEYIKPSGTFYLFINVNADSLKFTHHLLDKYHIAVTPGIAFGNKYNNYIRVACCKKYSQINTAFNYIIQEIKRSI